ncbi:MAG: alpha/beta fold hydrolase [Pseudomonadota bacterium]|nr:alpha/beta fold hydrolase [Pseudomonadota bacterium]
MSETEQKPAQSLKVDFPQFRERAPWFGGDLQTLRNFFARRIGRGPGDLPGERLELSLSDGGKLAARLTEGESDMPLAVVIHGLTGCETATNVVVAARHLSGLGFPVLRLNLRGSEPSAKLAKGHYHAGQTKDLHDILSALDPALTEAGIVFMGFSLGGNMLLKFLAESGKDFPVRAAVAVSTPIDLAESAARLLLRRNRLYHRWLLDRMKDQWRDTPLRGNAAKALDEVTSIVQFDDRIVAPVNGFKGAKDYYKKNSAERFLKKVAVPTLLIHAQNDPWIGTAPYARFDWPSNPNLGLLMPRGGGHVGFHSRNGPTPWHCVSAGKFFKGISALT